jgi:multiple sugar transport system permease protein
MVATDRALVSGRSARRWRLFRENAEGWLFISPFVIGFFVFLVRPFITSIYYSFTRYDFMSPPIWVGLGNYRSLIGDAQIWQTLVWTTLFAVFSVPTSLLIGLVLALIANTNVRGIAFLRTLYYLPSQINPVAMASVWAWIFNPSVGLLNYVLSLVGIEGPKWLGDPRWLLPATVIMMAFGAGGSMIINLAGLQSIPISFYEAAQLDGASSWQMLLRITLPLMSPTIFFNLVMGIIGALQSFTTLYLLLGNNAPVYMVQLYRIAFDRLNIGFGSAMAWVLFFYIMALTALVFRTATSWVYYEAGTQAR